MMIDLRPKRTHVSEARLRPSDAARVSGARAACTSSERTGYRLRLVERGCEEDVRAGVVVNVTVVYAAVRVYGV